MQDDGWTPRPDLDGIPADQAHPLFVRDRAEIVECRSRVANGVEIIQGSLRWWKREGGRHLFSHRVFGAFTVPTELPVLYVDRKRKLGLPKSRDGTFPIEEFDEQMRVEGDAELMARVLTPEVRAWTAEHLHHSRWRTDIGGRHVSIHAEARVFGNDDLALTVARFAYLFHELAGSTLVATPAPGWWAADPFGRHEQRWWDGSAWTDHVADAGATSTDPALPS